MFDFLKSTPPVTAESLKNKTTSILAVFTTAKSELETVMSQQSDLYNEKNVQIADAEEHIVTLKDEQKGIKDQIGYTQKMIEKISNFLN